jgi:phosphate:Na+ symporter
LAPASEATKTVSATNILLDLLGGAALLLWGLRMVRTGLMRGVGGDLRRFLGRSLGNRAYAFAAGLGVTVLLQSSSATCLLATSFAERGLMATAPALAVMLGADVGTSLVAQLLSLNLHWLSPLLVLAGVIAFMSSDSGQHRDIGRAVIGLGLMLLALRLVVGASAPMRDSQVVQTVLSALANEPLLAVLVGALLTWAAHSSLAMVLLVMTLADEKLLTVGLALALVVGANLGGGLPPFLAARGAEPAARRVPLGNLGFRLVGAIVVLAALTWIAPWVAKLEPDPARQVVNFHTAFNLALALVFLPFTGVVAQWLARLLPDKAEERDDRPRYLDAGAVETPSLALAAATRETLRMGDTIEAMLRGTLDVLRTDDRKRAEHIALMDNTVDKLYEATKLYLTKVSREDLSEQDNRRCADIIAFITNLEHIGDIVDKNLIELAEKKMKRKLRFSEEGFQEICALHGRLLDNLKLALSVFLSGEVATARRLLEEKVQFRDLERAASERHLARLREGRPESIETSALHLDILRDFKRINSHITSVAYPILEAAGALSATRLKEV